MRRLAYHHRREASRLEESARELRSVAAAIRGALAPIPGISRMVWQGPAATRFEEEAAIQSAHLDVQADEITAEAVRFDREADDLRVEAARLFRQADRHEANQAAASTGSTIPAGS